MIKIAKDFNNRPPKLQVCFKENEENLIKKKGNHSFDNQCYNNSIIKELRVLYINKCGFCETSLNDSEQTVEHYRPKKGGYYWLGYEWSNLILCCKVCNGNKDDKFPIKDSRKRIISPQLNSDKTTICLEDSKANSKRLLSELATILHPEVDNPEKYFSFKVDGTLVLKPDMTKWHNRRATDTIDAFKLNRQSLILNRKKKFDTLYESLRRVLINFYKYTDKSDRNDYSYRLSFFPFFDTLIDKQRASAEFSLFGKFILKNFKTIFFNKLRKEYEKDSKSIEDDLEKAFRLYLIENS